MSRPDLSKDSTSAVYCGSGKAIATAAVAFAPDRPMKPEETKGLCDALIAMHHPDLGSDRSVCLRDVIEALEIGYHGQAPSFAHPADYITKRFCGDGHEGLEC